jgi:hypothetical protein
MDGHEGTTLPETGKTRDAPTVNHPVAAKGRGQPHWISPDQNMKSIQVNLHTSRFLICVKFLSFVRPNVID